MGYFGAREAAPASGVTKSRGTKTKRGQGVNDNNVISREKNEKQGIISQLIVFEVKLQVCGGQLGGR
jgi:hypothetical protein